MSNNQEYKDLREFRVYGHLINYGILHMLKETLERFLHCKVVAYPRPSTQIKKYFQIDILENPRRGFYPINENNVVIIARVLRQRKLISALGIHLSGDKISENVKLLNRLEGSLTSIFSHEFDNDFINGSPAFGDDLIKHTITNYICQGYYDFRNIKHLIDYFFKLRTTSLEGNFFSTGAIITKAVHDFIDRDNLKRNGQALELSNWIRVDNSNKINKRMWYLADGKTSFFLGTKNLDFTQLFILNSEYVQANYLEAHSLALTLKGGDALFKVENEKLFSISTPTGFEFLFFENQWKFRNYRYLMNLIRENITTDNALIDSIIFFLLSCSKKQLSSIIWFPKDMSQIDNTILPATKNRILSSPINIKDKRLINHIFRCLSSDGATIINKDGDIEYIGVIVDLSKVSFSGLKGTGESAASSLASNGVAIKISQDGDIKIFTEKSKDPYIF